MLFGATLIATSSSPCGVSGNGNGNTTNFYITSVGYYDMPDIVLNMLFQLNLVTALELVLILPLKMKKTDA